MSRPSFVQKPQSEQQIAQMFNRIASRYDLLNTILSAKQDQRWRKLMISWMPDCESGTHLDVATGTGDIILASAARKPGYRNFIGVDIAEKMLEKGKIKAKKTHYGSQVDFQQMSAENLRLDDQSVDCVTIAFGLRNVVNRSQALKEFSRILRPQGSLLILEFFTPSAKLFGRIFNLYFHVILPKLGEWISGDRHAYTYLPQSVGSFYTQDQLTEALLKVGLKPGRSKRFLGGGCRLIEAIKS